MPLSFSLYHEKYFGPLTVQKITVLLLTSIKTLFLFSHCINQFAKECFSKQEAHGPHRSPEKTVQINKHIGLYHNVD